MACSVLLRLVLALSLLLCTLCKVEVIEISPFTGGIIKSFTLTVIYHSYTKMINLMKGQHLDKELSWI